MQDHKNTQELPSTSVLVDERHLVEADIFHIEKSFYLNWVKPPIDVLLGLIGVVIAIPPLLAIGFLVWYKMGSPVVLKQTRMGRFNVPFTLYKFRTMDPDRRSREIQFVGRDRRVTHKSATDPRITEIGRILRATRLDELPQLFNIVLGDLSMVGPRPELVSVIRDEYEPWQYRRHAVKPGLTGVWQVSDRGDQRLHECTEFELSYLNDVSLGTDLRIMAATLPAVLRRSGI
ncbi:MAG: sugar transferase [Acidimicrobiia bacterium]